MNDKALNAFIAKRAVALKLLKAIEAELDDHMNIHPDTINWAHVGDANYVLENLRDVARFMGHAE